MNIFYTPDIENRLYTLNPAESSHCVKVLRYKKGDPVRLIDGKGGLYDAVIIDDNWKACRLELVSETRDFEPLPYQLELALAPTKNTDRFEWFLEKATEIGVSVITPVLCDHSERKHIRMDRMEKVIIAAMKQSLKAYKPVFNEPVLLKDWISLNNCSTRLIAHCMDGDKPMLWNMPLSDDICIAIGPEGDFSQEEVIFAEKSGFTSISLGNYRLRTETAGVVACSGVYMSRHK